MANNSNDYLELLGKTQNSVTKMEKYRNSRWRKVRFWLKRRWNGFLAIFKKR